MKTRQNKYSIRKFSVGTASALIGALLFIGGGQAQAEESQDQTSPETTQAQSIDNKSDETQQAHSTAQHNQPTIHKAQKPSQSENKQEDEATTSDKHSENSDENQPSLQQEQSNVDHSKQETPKSSEQPSSETQPSSTKTVDTTSEVTDKQSDKKDNRQEVQSNEQQKNVTQENRSDAEQLNEDKGFNTQLYDDKEEQTNKKSEPQPHSEKEDEAQTSEKHDEDKSTETQPTSHPSTEQTTKSDETTTEDKDEKDVATNDSTDTQTEEVPQAEEDQTTESKGDNDSSKDQQNNGEESTKEAPTKDDETTKQQSSESEEDTSSSEKSQDDSTEEKSTEAQPKSDEQHDASQSNEIDTSSSEVASTEESTSEDKQSQQTAEAPTKDTTQQSEEDRNDENRFPVAGERTSEQTKTEDESTTQQQPNRTVSLEDLENTPMLPGSSQDQDDKQQQKELAALKANSQATTNNNNTKLTLEATTDQTNKVAKQAEYKNEDPIILVHGFNSFVGENADGENNWGGEVLDIGQYLENNGYESYQASISAYGSNYDRAVELYYYIKGGTVDYGAAHAEKYGHARYGKTYEGVYKDWQPGQKVHLVGHSMGGQTVRYLEEMLRNGNQEEIEYQRQHGGEISPLYQGGHDNMVSSITTVVTPHNGTHAADLLGNEDFIRQVAYDYITLNGSKTAKVDFGLSQWGLKQREDETYLEYVDRVKKTSKLWTTKDNAFYDLTTQGAEELNNKTTLNPNIVYKTYTGESTYEGLNGEQKADIHMALSKILTANVIGKVPEKEWRENDGLVSVISAQHPFGENSTAATDQVQKGIWQVTPTRHDWDHSDFVGHDKTEQNVDAEELKKLWGGIAEDAVKAEHVVG